ncbi:MAG: MotA/TolQ/ExbB proton channel family protein [bacterium]
MHFISLTALVSLALIGERFFFLFKSSMNPESFLRTITKKLREGDYNGAIRYCDSIGKPLSKIIGAGLRNYKDDIREMQNAVDEVGLAEIPRINQRLNYLPVLSQVATLLGLLGTIAGLLKSFAALLTASASTRTMELIKGISVALNTTFFGLSVAIPVMLFHAFLQAKADGIVDDIDEYAVKIMNMLQDIKKG